MTDPAPLLSRRALARYEWLAVADIARRAPSRGAPRRLLRAIATPIGSRACARGTCSAVDGSMMM